MSYTPRMSRPTAGNKYYIRKSEGGYSNAIYGNPRDNQCNVLANCVGYAYGRFNEIGGYGYCKYLAPVNAENFMNYKGSCKTGNTPKLGACMVWEGKGDLAGHVAIVEQIIDSNHIITSESGYGASSPFWTQHRYNNNGNWGLGSNYKFKGFIYNPAVNDDPTPTPVPPSGKFKVGDKVIINGQLYGNADGGNPGQIVTNRVTTITRVATGHLYPYNTTGDLGWMCEAAIKLYEEPAPKPETFKVGDKVKPLSLVDYKGTHLRQYDDYYTIMQIDNRGAVLGAPRNGQLQVWAVLSLNNIKKIG